MSQFRYTGRDAQGARVTGTLQSASSDSVASELLAQKITPLTIEEQREQGGDDLLAMLTEKLRRRRVDLEELIIFCRQMYSLS